VNYPFRENLEVESAADGRWFRCANCGRRLCAFGQDWKTAALTKLFPPAHAGPLMKVLDGRYLFKKIYCPSCGVLFNAEMVKQKHEA
jgi:acetone carboxylase gamma subunit